MTLQISGETKIVELSKKLIKRGFRQNVAFHEWSSQKLHNEIKRFQTFAKKHNFQGSEGWFLPEKEDYPSVLEHITPEDIVLDVGAGNFALDLLLAEKCKKVYAVEVNPEVVSDALKVIGYEQPRNLIIVCANGLDFPVPKDVNTLVMLLRHFTQEFPSEWQNIPKIIAQVYETWIITEKGEN